MNNDNFPILIYRNWLATFTAMSPDAVGYIIKDLSCRVLTGEPMINTPDELKIMSNQIYDEVSEALEKYSEKRAKNQANAQKRWNNRNADDMQPQCDGNTNALRTHGISISKTISKTISNDTNVSINNSSTKTHSRFVPPALDDIRLYIIEKNYSVDAEAFFNFYESKNWYVGKNKMANWKAAIANWERKEQKEQKTVDPIMDAIMNFGGEDIGK